MLNMHGTLPTFFTYISYWSKFYKSLTISSLKLIYLGPNTISGKTPTPNNLKSIIDYFVSTSDNPFITWFKNPFSVSPFSDFFIKSVTLNH